MLEVLDVVLVNLNVKSLLLCIWNISLHYPLHWDDLKMF